jgi:hypothetical protein
MSWNGIGSPCDRPIGPRKMEQEEVITIVRDNDALI